MNYTIVIPARMNSTRLPQKMMLDLGGMPLIERTWRQAKKNTTQPIIIATDHAVIFDHMKQLGAEIMMTHADHPSGTDRLSEVVRHYDLKDDQIVVNWQGDEPFLHMSLLDQIAQLLIDQPSAAISTLAILIETMPEFLDPNVVKVVQDQAGFALYFSRAPIPFPRDSDLSALELPKDINPLRHLGMYAYRAGFLKQYPDLIPAPLETIEKLEQLRALYNGFKIAIGRVKVIPPPGIDTPLDLINAQKWLSLNNL